MTVEMRHLTLRGRWPIDTLFPATLRGEVDSWGVDEGTADALYGLVRLVAPSLVLETGTHKGRSTRAIAKALRDNAHLEMVPGSTAVSLPSGHLFTVDMHDYNIHLTGALLPGTELFVTQVIGKTPEVLGRPPLADLQGIDFAFLDGDHTAAGLEAELLYLEHHRARECWVAVDNSQDPGWPGVAQVLRACRHPRVSFASCTGLDILWMRD